MVLAMAVTARGREEPFEQMTPQAVQAWLETGQDELNNLRQRSLEIVAQLNAEELYDLRDYFYTLSFWEVFDGVFLEMLDDYAATKAWLQHKQAKERRAFTSLSKLQKQILIKIYNLSQSGFGKLKWEPQKWFEKDARTVFSRSIQSLDSRGLVFRYSAKYQRFPKRTVYVELSALGHRLAKQLSTEEPD